MGIELVAADEEAPRACKATIQGAGATPTRTWSDGEGIWIAQDAFVTQNVVYSVRCDVRIPLGPGTYRVRVSFGPRHELVEELIDVNAGFREILIEPTPPIGSREWKCADLHVHSAPSFDSDVPKDQRLVSAAAEGLDTLVPSDHDAVGDWDLPLDTVGLSEQLTLVRGDEITPDQWSPSTPIGHVGLFPVPSGFEPSAVILPGADMAQLVDVATQAAPNGILQINHPRWNRFIGWFDAMGWQRVMLLGDAASEIEPFGLLEVWNGRELVVREDGSTRRAVMRDWWALLNAGVGIVATGNSDTHGLAVGSVGYPRTCVRLPASAPGPPAQEPFVDALRRGAAFVTSGPFMRLTVNGARPGETIGQDGTTRIEASIDAPGWIGVDRFTAVINGEMRGTRALEGSLPATVDLTEDLESDAWVIGMVEGDDPMGPLTGRRERPLPTLAFSNPVFVDVDGDGIWTPPAMP